VKRRTELARGAPLVTRKGLAPGRGLGRAASKPREASQPRSKATKAPSRGNDIPQASRDLLAARSGGVCEVQAPGPCTHTATDFHHRQRRREGDHSVTNAIHACRRCHRLAHDRPELARAFGWIVSAWSAPADTPLMLRGEQWVLLSETYTPCDDPTSATEGVTP
jgi:hypothetical protein